MPSFYVTTTKEQHYQNIYKPLSNSNNTMINKEYTQRELDSDFDRVDAFVKYFKENPERIVVNKRYIQDFYDNIIRRVSQDKDVSALLDKGEVPAFGAIRNLTELFLFSKNFISNPYNSEGAKK